MLKLSFFYITYKMIFAEAVGNDFMNTTVNISRCGEIEAVLLVLMAQQRLRSLLSRPGIRDEATRQQKRRTYVEMSHLIAWASGVQEVIYGMINGKGKCRF